MYCRAVNRHAATVRGLTRSRDGFRGRFRGGVQRHRHHWVLLTVKQSPAVAGPHPSVTRGVPVLLRSPKNSRRSGKVAGSHKIPGTGKRSRTRTGRTFARSSGDLSNQGHGQTVHNSRQPWARAPRFVHGDEHRTRPATPPPVNRAHPARSPWLTRRSLSAPPPPYLEVPGDRKRPAGSILRAAETASQLPFPAPAQNPQIRTRSDHVGRRVFGTGWGGGWWPWGVGGKTR